MGRGEHVIVRSRRIGRVAPIALAIATVLSGCLGASSRADFEEMVQARGGGVSTSAIDGLLDDVRDRAGANDPEIRAGRINFLAATATFEVRNPTRPGELDRYLFGNEELVSSEPIRLTTDDDLDTSTAPLSTFALGDVEALADIALAEFDSTGGYVTGLTVLARVDPPVMQVDVESPRSSGAAVFSADGKLLEFRR